MRPKRRNSKKNILLKIFLILNATLFFIFLKTDKNIAVKNLSENIWLNTIGSSSYDNLEKNNTSIFRKLIETSKLLIKSNLSNTKDIKKIRKAYAELPEININMKYSDLNVI